MATLGVKELRVKDCEGEGCNKRDLRERTQPNGVIIRVPGRDQETEYAIDMDYCTDLGSVQPAKCNGPNHFARMCSLGRPTHLVEEV